MTKRTIAAVVLASCAGLLTGCATQTAPVSFVYAPTMSARGGSGELFLKSASCDAVASSANQVRWVIGKRKDSEGRVTGEVLSRLSAEDMVLDALKRELTVAGYQLACGSVMPPGVPKGLDLVAGTVAIEETAGVSKVEANVKVQVSLDIWKGGNKIRRVSYQSRMTDFAVLDRDRLPRELIEQGLQAVMRQAAPEIVSTLEGK